MSSTAEPCRDGHACLWAQDCGTRLYCPFPSCVLMRVCEHADYDTLRRRVVDVRKADRRLVEDT